MVLRVLSAFIAGAMLVAACGSDDSDPTGSVTRLPPLEYEAATSATDVFMVNVHIDGIDAFIPFDDIGAHADELPADKDAPLCLYCRSGRMSQDATPDLQALGYTNIIDL